MECPRYVNRLLNAFIILGGDENGLIDYSKIEALFKNKKVPDERIYKLLESNCCREGNKLNFLKLCTSVLKTKVTLDRIQTEAIQATNDCKKINTRTFTRKKGPIRAIHPANNGKLSEHKPSQDQQSSLKGCIFDLEESLLCGHRYQLEITENSPIEIVAQAIDINGCCSLTPGIEILLFRENDEPNKKLVTFSSSVDSRGYCAIKMNLKKGKYLLVPVTLNWRGIDIDGQHEYDADELTEIDKEGEVALTSTCKKTLKTIFDLLDLDRNGFLSQSEFDLFIQHICGESSSDEWSTVEDNFHTVNGQLSYEGFLMLYKMAIVTDAQDVIHMFTKMGLNNSWNMQKVLPFLLTVSAKNIMPVLQPLPICIFDSLMEEVFRKTTIEQGHCSKIRNLDDLLLYTHKLRQRVTIVVLNKSRNQKKVHLDCRNSDNCVSHQKTLDYTLEIPPRTSMVGHHLFPENGGIPWSVHCIESLIE